MFKTWPTVRFSLTNFWALCFYNIRSELTMSYGYSKFYDIGPSSQSHKLLFKEIDSLFDLRYTNSGHRGRWLFKLMIQHGQRETWAKFSSQEDTACMMWAYHAVLSNVAWLIVENSSQTILLDRVLCRYILSYLLEQVNIVYKNIEQIYSLF
jgi:hypothetical protein